MGDIPFYRRSWFYIAAWIFFLLIAYAWDIISMGGFRINEVRIFTDVFCVFPILLMIWMAFFSQFVLPLSKVGDRFRILYRMILRLVGIKGPAIFIENGQERKSEGEERRKGPGVLWLDSASAAVIRTATKIKRTIGPGVHFITKKELVAGTLDLHIQLHTVGPREEEIPFAGRTEPQTEVEFNVIQDRRKQVSGWTRDGIEIVPNISVIFRVDTGFPSEGQAGSRFGYRTGTSPRDRKHEAEDKKAIQAAILGESINPHYESSSPYHRIAWNQLPGALAVDVWREYASKFNLQQFFEPSVFVHFPAAQPPQPAEEEIDHLTQSFQVGNGPGALPSSLAGMLHIINMWISRRIERLEGKNQVPPNPAPPHTPPEPPVQNPSPAKTAFQAINDLVKARLTQEFFESYDANGRHLDDQPPAISKEYGLLRDRGLKVLSVTISNPRVPAMVEKTLIDVWKSNWLEFIKLENEQISQRHSLFETSGQEEAIRRYALALSDAIIQDVPASEKSGLKTLLNRTRAIIIRNDQLRGKMNTELQELEDIMRWIEANGR